jgi:hypothetical protein
MLKHREPKQNQWFRSVIHCFFNPWIRDVKNPEKILYSDPGFNYPDHIFEGTKKIVWLNTNIICCRSGTGIRHLLDPGSGTETFGSGKNIPDPQHRTEHST